MSSNPQADWTPTQHRDAALGLADFATGKSYTDPARLVLLTEAVLQAVLAISAPTADTIDATAALVAVADLADATDAKPPMAKPSTRKRTPKAT